MSTAGSRTSGRWTAGEQTRVVAARGCDGRAGERLGTCGATGVELGGEEHAAALVVGPWPLTRLIRIRSASHRLPRRTSVHSPANLCAVRRPQASRSMASSVKLTLAFW